MNSSTESQAGSVPPSDTQTEETGPTAAPDQTAPPPATTQAPPPAPASPVKRSKSKLKEKKQVVRDITLNNFSTLIALNSWSLEWSSFTIKSKIDFSLRCAEIACKIKIILFLKILRFCLLVQNVILVERSRDVALNW